MATDVLLQSRVIKTDLIDWKLLKFIQQDDFKALSAFDKAKLKRSILANHFIQPFYVWEEGGNMHVQGTLYCLDGKHRCDALYSLELDGHEVPPLLPATFIRVANKTEAAKLVLLFSSHYAHITKPGLDTFLDIYALNIDEVLEQISLPDLEECEAMQLPEDNELTGSCRNKPSTMKITFDSPTDVERAMPLIKALLDEHFKTAYFSVSSGEI